MSEFRRHASRLQAQHIDPVEVDGARYVPASWLRSSIWQADVASLVLLVVFVLFVTVAERAFQPRFSNNGLLLTGLAISVLPAVVWLAFFYRRDRREPEPKLLVLQQFVLGALLASAVGIPLVENIFAVPTWLGSSPIWAQLLGGLLIVGFVQEFVKYAAVRFSVYNSDEFDELTDGIVYTTAAGLGFATILNIHFIIASGGVALGLAAVRIVLTTLAHASFAGVTGYFLGREKFEDHPLWWMPLGIFLAASLNSLFYYFRGLLAQGSLGAGSTIVGAWAGLILAVLLMASVTAVLSYLIRRDLALLLDPAVE